MSLTNIIIIFPLFVQWARVGAHSITRNEGTRINVKKEIVSKKYNPSNTNYDFMILVLEEPAPEDIPLARLHDGSDMLRDGDSLTVIGWGNTATSGWSMPDKKQHVEVKYIDTDDCNSRNSYDGKITNAMMCAGEDSGGEDACQGDSGGPLVRLGEEGKPDELVGVVSWGYGVSKSLRPHFSLTVPLECLAHMIFLCLSIVSTVWQC